MAFTYDPTTAQGQVRLLIPDTDSSNFIFADDEINAFLAIESSQALYVSPQSAPTALPLNSVYVPQVYSVLLAAALALDSLAGNSARLAGVLQILDVKIDLSKAAKALHDQANAYREREENQGHFAIAEQVVNDFTARERTINQWLRLFNS